MLTGCGTSYEPLSAAVFGAANRAGAAKAPLLGSKSSTATRGETGPSRKTSASTVICSVGFMSLDPVTTGSLTITGTDTCMADSPHRLSRRLGWLDSLIGVAWPGIAERHTTLTS